MVKGPIETIVIDTTQFKGDPEYIHFYISLIVLYENYMISSEFSFKKWEDHLLNIAFLGIVSGCGQAY